MPLKDPEKRREYNRKYREDNHERIIAYDKSRPARPRDMVKKAEYDRKWKASQPKEKKRAMSTAGSRRFRAANPGYDAAMRQKNQTSYSESARNCNAKRLYGLSSQEVRDMFASQGFSCAICGSTSTDKSERWHVDHDHVTGRVRGVLCTACNQALGLLVDNPALIRAAAEYLEK